MTPKFLCPQHRQWLYINPEVACTTQHKNYDTAEYYNEIGEITDALKFAGCAYECAEIVLTLHARNIQDATLSFTASAILLGSVLIRGHHTDKGVEVFGQALKRLHAERVLHYGDESALTCIKACITSLQDGLDYYESQLRKAATTAKVQAAFNQMKPNQVEFMH